MSVEQPRRGAFRSNIDQDKDTYTMCLILLESFYLMLTDTFLQHIICNNDLQLNISHINIINEIRAEKKKGKLVRSFESCSVLSHLPPHVRTQLATAKPHLLCRVQVVLQITLLDL